LSTNFLQKTDDFLQVEKENLQPHCAIGDGGSWQLMVDMLYHIRLLRYVTQTQIKIVNSRYEKIATKKKLTALVQLGYLTMNAGSYRATKKTTELLKALGYNITLLQPEPEGNGGVDSIKKTDVFIQALRLPNFKALLFPQFPKENPYVKPDALLVLVDDKENPTKYQLNFLEIEAEKQDWDAHLEGKRINYERLGYDDQAYSYWVAKSGQIGFRKPTREQFCFRVMCVGNIKKEWRGWEFRKEI